MTKEVSTTTGFTAIPPTQDRLSLKAMTFEWNPSESESTDKTTESLAVTTHGDHKLSVLAPKPPPVWQDDGDGKAHGGGGRGGGGNPSDPMGGEDGKLGEALGKTLTWIVANIPNWFPVFDKAGRAEFTQRTVREMWENTKSDKIGGFVITYVDYASTRALWSNNVNFGNLTYTLIAFPRGDTASFVLNGDGGYINWAVIGYFERIYNRIDFY